LPVLPGIIRMRISDSGEIQLLLTPRSYSVSKQSEGGFMSATFLRMSLCAVVMADLAGCGGGSNKVVGGGGGNPATVTYDFSNGAAPAAVATQIGTAAYTQATLESGKVTFTLPTGETKFAVAYLCPPRSGENPPPNYEYIHQLSTVDGTSFSGYCFEPSTVQTGLATVQVNAAAITGASLVAVGGEDQQWSTSSLSFSVQMRSGTSDVPVYVYDAKDSILAIKILPRQTIPGALNGGNPVVFAASDQVALQPITYSNLPAGFTPGISANYTTSGGTTIPLDVSNTTEYPSIPAASVQSGDYYSFTAGAKESPASSLNEYAQALLDTKSGGGPETFTLPSPWAYIGPTPSALPTFTIGYLGFSGMTRVAQYADIFWGTNLSNGITIDATENYQGGATSLTIPDLSGVTGFLAQPASGTKVEWDAGMNQVLSTAASLPDLNEVSVGNSGTYTVP